VNLDVGYEIGTHLSMWRIYEFWAFGHDR